MEKIETESGTTYYCIEGKGEQTIVFTHGATMDHQMFSKQVDFFKETYRIVYWDVPMHGRSRPYNEFTLEEAASVLHEILEKEQIRQVHLVGQSMGGYISQIFANEYPDKVLSLSIVDSLPVQFDYYSWLDRFLLKMTTAMVRISPIKILRRTMPKQVSITEHGQQYAREVQDKLSRSEISYITQKVHFGLCDYSFSEVTLSCPILVLNGEKDKTIGLISAGKRWIEKEGIEEKIIHNAGHNSNMDNPDEFNKLLEEFLAGLQ